MPRKRSKAPLGPRSPPGALTLETSRRWDTRRRARDTPRSPARCSSPDGKSMPTGKPARTPGTGSPVSELADHNCSAGIVRVSVAPPRLEFRCDPQRPPISCKASIHGICPNTHDARFAPKRAAISRHATSTAQNLFFSPPAFKYVCRAAAYSSAVSGRPGTVVPSSYCCSAFTSL